MDPRSGRALVVGESLVDVVLDPSGAALTRAPGGSALNVAVGLARLDVATILATCVGDDDLGALIGDHARASGVAFAPGSAGRYPTGTATARLDADGAATYDFSLRWELPRPHLGPDLLVVHVGSLGTVLEPGATTVAACVEDAVRRGIPLSYDPNVRPAMSPDRAAAWGRVQRLGALSRVVKVSEEDLSYLQPGRDVAAVLEELLSGSRTELAVCTLGGAGALALSGSASAQVAAPAVDVVDTVGAGDAFTAALLAVLAELGFLGAAAPRLADTDLARLLRFAVLAAAITCSRRGADPPHRDELTAQWPRPLQ